MEQTSRPGLRWRVFAVIVAILLLLVSWISPVTGPAGLTWNTVKTVYWLMAPLGLLGYAFGFRLVGLTFWRAYAVIFVLEITIRMSRFVWVLVERAAGWPADDRHSTSIILFALGCTILICIALLRHAELIDASPAHGRA